VADGTSFGANITARHRGRSSKGTQCRNPRRVAALGGVFLGRRTRAAQDIAFSDPCVSLEYLVVCTENLNADVMMMKPAEEGHVT
jgi:hypothetical protein